MFAIDESSFIFITLVWIPSMMTAYSIFYDWKERR